MSRLNKTLAFLGMVSLLFASGTISLNAPKSSAPALQPMKVLKPLELRIANPIEPIKGWPIDTLKNDDGDPEYYLSPPSFFFASRLSPTAPCTLLALMFAKQRGLSRDTAFPVVAGCSLVICKDTMVSGNHTPGRRLIIGYGKDSLPHGWYGAWFIYQIFPYDTFRFSAEDFWVGYRYVRLSTNLSDTLYPLADDWGDPSRNAYGLYSTGPWNFYPMNWYNRAIVKYEAVDVHDIEVLSVGNNQGYFMPNPGNAQLSGIITNSGNVSEPTVTVACTVYTEAGAPVANWSQPVGPIGVNETLEVFFSPNWTPNTDGVYRIVVHSLLANDDRPQNDRKDREAQVCSSPAELRYDDGERDGAWAFYRKGNGWANKFVSPYYPAKLTGVKYCAWSDSWPQPGGTRIVARILDDDGPDGLPGTILWQETVNVNRGTFTLINVEPNVEINSGAFYVAWIQADTWVNSPGLSIDEDGPFAREIYTFYRDTWYYDPDPMYGGDWMIRAVIERVGGPQPGGWVSKPQPTPTKPIKGGGGITARGDSLIFLIPGNNTLDFWKYNTNSNSWTSITPGVPLGLKNKKVKKGAYIVDSDRNDKGVEGEVYVLKGGGTQEFYCYDPLTKGWDSLPEPGFTKGVKGGFATFVEIDGEDYIYVGSGSNTNEWKRYKISARTWEAITPALPVEKAKIGSGLAWDLDKKIYFLHGGGKTNDFYVFDLTTSSWTGKKELPLSVPGTTKKKKVKEGGSIEYWNGLVYAVKGGNTKEFWAYFPDGDSWHCLGEVGNGAPQKGIKCGRSLTSTSQGIYCIIGNNTNEFWFYSGGKSFNTLKPAISGKTTLNNLTLEIKPNPTRGLTTISYNLPTKEPANLRIYNVTGDIVYSATSEKGIFTIRELPAGIYLVRLETKGWKVERKLIVVK
uniref:T9SS type A sorting domain-containing protein n=1 Tax=candidate division WOR-3 bacterium TaxID=2052148 RepID=A0A7C3UYH8_UNCW3